MSLWELHDLIGAIISDFLENFSLSGKCSLKKNSQVYIWEMLYCSCQLRNSMDWMDALLWKTDVENTSLDSLWDGELSYHHDGCRLNETWEERDLKDRHQPRHLWRVELDQGLAETMLVARWRSILYGGGGRPSRCPGLKLQSTHSFLSNFLNCRVFPLFSSHQLGGGCLATRRLSNFALERDLWRK